MRCRCRYRPRILRGALFIALAFQAGRTGDARAAADSALGSKAAPAIEIRVPADIVYTRGLSGDSTVSFSHVTHFEFAGRKCTTCHVALYPILQPRHRLSHSVMDAGASCGTCHDGERAFGTMERRDCGICHAGLSGGQVRTPDSGTTSGQTIVLGSSEANAAIARRVPAPHAYPRGKSSPGSVVFAHGAHLANGEACVDCHPRPYPMRFTASPASDELHGATSCGSCHDGRRLFGFRDGATCDRCHAGRGGAR